MRSFAVNKPRHAITTFGSLKLSLYTFDIGLIPTEYFNTILNMKKATPLAEKRRVLLDLSRIGFPEIPLLGAYNLSAATKGLQEHSHPGTVEICYLVKGEQVYTIDGQDYLLKGNDVFVTYPGEEHGTGGNPEGKGMLYWMQIKVPPPQHTFLGLTCKEAKPLLKRLEKFSARHFRGSRKLQLLFERIVEKYETARSDPLEKLSMATALIEWLLIVVERSSHMEAQKLTLDIEQVVRLMKQDLEESRSMDDYARSIHLSTSRFKAKFKEQVGVPPGEYCLRCKIEAAKVRLKSTEDHITDIAYDLGFSSSQYFATTFKRFETLTPREYRTRNI